MQSKTYGQARELERKAAEFREQARSLATQWGILPEFEAAREAVASLRHDPDVEVLSNLIEAGNNLHQEAKNKLKSAIETNDTELVDKTRILLVSLILRQAHDMDLAATHMPSNGPQQ